MGRLGDRHPNRFFFQIKKDSFPFHFKCKAIMIKYIQIEGWGFELMLRMEHFQVGEARLALEAVVVQTMDGLNIYLGGGEKTHIGTVVLCQLRPSLKNDGSYSTTSSILNLVCHKDDGIAKPLAEKLCLAFKQTVVVTAGVHIDSATPREIEYLLQLSAELSNRIIDHLIKQEPQQ
jgi:hypothetical protein